MSSYSQWCPTPGGAEKDATASNYLSILSVCSSLAAKTATAIRSRGNCVEIDALLPRDLPSDQLFRLGISTYLIAFPQEASATFHLTGFSLTHPGIAPSFSRSAQIRVRVFLRKMQPICGPDGGEHLMYSELMDPKKKLRKDAKTK